MKFFFSLWVVSAMLTFRTAGQTQPILNFEQGKVYLSLDTSFSESSSAPIKNDQWKDILPVYTQEAFLRRLDQPVSGNYHWNGDTITFTPSFSFASGEIYHAVFDGQVFSNITRNSSADSKLELSFSIPKEEFALTSIESVYPESSLLPENLLRMYIHFSAPMMPGGAYDHIKLFRGNGTIVDRAFLIVDQELWDSERKRFTLLFDPGRIKRDLKANQEFGTPLREGETYRLVIDSTWRDVHGSLLSRSVSKTFSVTEAKRTKLTTRQWNVIPPLVDAKDDLVISFDRPMDHALMSKYIVISNASSGMILGKIHSVSDTVLRFTPDHPWQRVEYVISISPLLEDVAGNNFNNSFDVDLSKDKRVYSSEPVKIRFTTSALTE
jgi:hypothetical protein